MEAGLATIPVREIDGLTADQEADFLLVGNLLDEHGRNLSEAQRYEIERRLLDLHGKRRGERTDRKRQAAELGTSRHERESSAVVATLVGASPSAVADRAKVFGSLASTEALRSALASGRIKRSAAAKAVRESERNNGIGNGRDEHDGALEAARLQVDAWVSARLETQGPDRTGPGTSTELTCFNLGDPDGFWKGRVGSAEVEVRVSNGNVVLRWRATARRSPKSSGDATAANGGGADTSA